MLEKKKVICYLNSLLEHNIYASQKEIYSKAFKNRIIGFRSEIDFYNTFSERKLLSGGYILPVSGKAKTLEDPIYFTISNDSPNKYLELYSLLKKEVFTRLFFIQFKDYDIENWKEVDVMNNSVLFPVPEFSVYEFLNDEFQFISNNITDFSNLYKDKNQTEIEFKLSDSDKTYSEELLKRFKKEDLINIYVDRLVFDGFLGFRKVKGIASDIDAISVKDEKFVFCEIKEKDLSKKPPVGFGMDVRRIENIEKLSNSFGVNYLYLVRQVNNQNDRVFEDWLYISIEDFVKYTRQNNTIEGGAGMSNLGSNPTLVCELKRFKKIKR